MVFAGVLNRSDERSGDLAGYADQSRGQIVSCAYAYEALGKWWGSHSPKNVWRAPASPTCVPNLVQVDQF
ncbi:DUF2514 family protein [Pseudomonas grimontii]|uniref:DUF2514 family protein n=1 Tax=Pseudomonas grimontii TaxID=129847 RepID=A0A5C5PFT7_9PSED|nr:DUF2514 family protein [Pseudomonas grimontii]